MAQTHTYLARDLKQISCLTFFVLSEIGAVKEEEEQDKEHTQRYYEEEAEGEEEEEESFPQ